jgi:hypothetical protein
MKKPVSETFSSNPDNRKGTVVPDDAMDIAGRRRSLIEDSMGMRRQGARLVEEGNKFVGQGRRLLQTILGARTDEYIKNITRGRGRAVVTGDPFIIDAPEGVPGVPDAPDVEINIHDADARDEDSNSDTE